MKLNLHKIIKRFRKKPSVPAIYLWDKQKIIDADMAWYERGHGYRFDIRHPVLFTEKIQWYKLFYQDDRLPKIVDKAEFKTYIREHLGEGHTIPLLAVWDDIKSFEKSWPSLPESFCLKSTISGNGENIRIIKHKSEIDFASLKNEVAKWFDPKHTNLNSYCLGYYQCVPRVIAEEYAENIDGQLFDYKIFCFNGEPFCFYAASEHFVGDDHQNGYPIAFYDLEWNKLDVQYGSHRNDDIPKPEHRIEMIQYAKVLSKDFPFVRVDFFDTRDSLYLAEMTFYPGGGGTPFYPESFNRELGDLFVLQEKADY